jgi:hypothetical protein
MLLLRKVLMAAPPMLVGPVLLALSMAWSILDPNRGLIVVEGLAFSLGTVPRGGYQRHSWVIRNAGPLPLKLRTKFTSGRCGFSLWLGEDHIVPAGGLFTVSLTCPIPSSAGRTFSAHADVSTDLSNRPRLRFRVCGITDPTPAP